MHSSTNGYSNCLYHWANVNKAAMNIRVQVFVCAPAFSSLWHISRSRVLEPSSNCAFIFLRKCHATVHIVCTILHFRKQCVRVPISLHCCQHFNLFVLDYDHLLYVNGCSHCEFNLHVHHDMKEIYLRGFYQNLKPQDPA